MIVVAAAITGVIIAEVVLAAKPFYNGGHKGFQRVRVGTGESESVAIRESVATARKSVAMGESVDVTLQQCCIAVEDESIAKDRCTASRRRYNSLKNWNCETRTCRSACNAQICCNRHCNISNAVLIETESTQGYKRTTLSLTASPAIPCLHHPQCHLAHLYPCGH